MVYRILNIAAGILMGLAVPVGIVCLVYTLAMPTVRAGIEGVRSSFDNAVSAAAAAVGVDQAALDGWGASVAAMFSGAEQAAVPDGAGSGGAVQVSDFADPAQGEAYLAWKAVVADPVGSVLQGSGVSATVLAGVAGGSSSAGDALAALDETALVAIDANAKRYAALASGAEVSSVLPEDVRSRLWEANAAAQTFATAVQQMVGQVRELKAGGLGALAALAGTASTAVASANTIAACVSDAEEALR